MATRRVVLEESREQEFTIVGVSADFATSQLTTEQPQILLPLPEALAPTVHLIARGAPGDECGDSRIRSVGLRTDRVAVPAPQRVGLILRRYV